MQKVNEILTIDELAKYLNISKHTLYMMTSKDRIPHFKVGRQLRFRKSAINAWAEEQEKHKRKRR